MNNNCTVTIMLLLSQDEALYGIDWDGPSPLEDDAESVIVPECPCPLNDDEVDELAALVSPLQASQDYGIDLYQLALHFVTQHTS